MSEKLWDKTPPNGPMFLKIARKKLEADILYRKTNKPMMVVECKKCGEWMSPNQPFCAWCLIEEMKGNAAV